MFDWIEFGGCETVKSHRGVMQVLGNLAVLSTLRMASVASQKDREQPHRAADARETFSWTARVCTTATPSVAAACPT